MLLVVAVGEFVLQPIMADLKSAGLVEGSEQAIKFGRIHGLASLLFLFNSIAGLILVITGVYSPARN
jgi:hypothetical protein